MIIDWNKLASGFDLQSEMALHVIDDKRELILPIEKIEADAIAPDRRAFVFATSGGRWVLAQDSGKDEVRVFASRGQLGEFLWGQVFPQFNELEPSSWLWLELLLLMGMLQCDPTAGAETAARP